MVGLGVSFEISTILCIFAADYGEPRCLVRQRTSAPALWDLHPVLSVPRSARPRAHRRECKEVARACSNAAPRAPLLFYRLNAQV